jgi:hypothetical protein
MGLGGSVRELIEELEGNPVVAEMEEIFGERISDPETEGKWIVWYTNKSEQTLSKFVDRARAARIKGVFARKGKVGCLADQD